MIIYDVYHKIFAGLEDAQKFRDGVKHSSLRNKSPVWNNLTLTKFPE
jgi:hypothetical protein